MNAAGWDALSVLVDRLVAVSARAGAPTELCWRVLALERACRRRSVALLPLGLGATGRTPPAEVEAWRHDRAVVSELGEVAVWMVADAGCALAEGEAGDVEGAGVAVGAWAEG